MFLKAGMKEKIGLGKIETNLKQILRTRGLKPNKEAKNSKLKEDIDHIPTYSEIFGILQGFFERELGLSEQ